MNIEGLLIGGTKKLDHQGERAAVALIDEALKHPPDLQVRWIDRELRRQIRVHRQACWLLREMSRA